MNGLRWSWIVFAAAAIAASVVAGRGLRGNARGAAALAAERQKYAVLLTLRDENRRLTNGRLSAAEQSSLQSRHAEAQNLRSRLNALETGAGEAKVELSPDDPSRGIPARDWIYAGKADPKAAVESVLWAASHGDVDRLSELLGFAPDVRAQADATFSQLPPASQAEYGSAEKVIATLLAGSFPKNASAMRMLGEWPTGQGAVVSVTVDHSDGQERFNQLNLSQSPDGWRLLVPAGIMASYASVLQGGKEPPEAPAP